VVQPSTPASHAWDQDSVGLLIGYARPEELETVAGSFADRMRTVWSSISSDLPFSSGIAGAIDARPRDLPLAKGG
jgi:hypothetical protein